MLSDLSPFIFTWILGVVESIPTKRRARLLVGILSTTPNIHVKIKGDKSLNKRDMSKLIQSMSEFGAEFIPKNKKHFPLNLISSEIPVAIDYIAGNSAQIKSAVILAKITALLICAEFPAI